MKEITEAREVMENSNSVKILKGLIISVLITFALLFVFAIILTYTKVGEETIIPVVIAITGVSILAGSTMTTSSIKKNGILNGGIIGLIYMLFIYLASSITGNNFNLNMNSIIMLAIGGSAGIIGGIVGVNLK